MHANLICFAATNPVLRFHLEMRLPRPIVAAEGMGKSNEAGPGQLRVKNGHGHGQATGQHHRQSRSAGASRIDHWRKS